MADYNVNMKQWNGTSFDNVLPLAFNSKALEGKSYDDIVQYFHSNFSTLYSGQYVGTGTYGENNPCVVTFLSPIDLFIPAMGVDGGNDSISKNPSYPVVVDALSTKYTQLLFPYNDNQIYIKRSVDKKTIHWYSTYSASRQRNSTNTPYYYAGITGISPSNEFLIVQSTEWYVPKTGRYYMELYGGGGSSPYNSHWVGGSSCQTFDSITLTKGDVISITVGKANSGATDGTTKFGQYSVQGATAATDSAIGKGSGNKGKDGWYDQNQNVYNYSDGELGQRFGFGRNYAAGAGQGAVYLKYLGA